MRYQYVQSVHTACTMYKTAMFTCECFRQLEADAKCRTFNREDSEGSQRNEEAEAEELAVSWLDVMKR